MTFIKEFKEFAVKGNMMDMAIGIIIGASFNKVIDVLVKKVILPPLSLMTDGLNFQDKKFLLRDVVINGEGIVTTQEVAIEYGILLEASLDLLIVVIISSILIGYSSRDQSNYYSSFWIEGIPIIWFLLTMTIGS